MTKELIIITLILVLIYLYYQNKKLKGLPTDSSGNSTQTIYELDERSLSAFDKDEEDLIADKDEAIRKKNEAEAEALDLANKLKLKQQEVTKKDQEITRLKQEKSQSEISLNEKIKELKKKYSHREQLLDNEQLENNKLIEQIERLEGQNASKIKEHQEQLRAINLLFDPQAENYTEIDFAGLYSLLEKFTKKMPGSF